MGRRASCPLMWLGLLLALWAAGEPSEPLAAPPPPRRPNILWISAEDISPDLGCYGDAYARTPVLDSLARQGARYAYAFATAPVCAPSRSAIITGMYATTIGSLHMRSKAVPPAHVKAFPEYLRAAGYYCTNNAKTDYNFEAPPAKRRPDLPLVRQHDGEQPDVGFDQAIEGRSLREQRRGAETLSF